MLNSPGQQLFEIGGHETNLRKPVSRRTNIFGNLTGYSVSLFALRSFNVHILYQAAEAFMHPSLFAQRLLQQLGVLMEIHHPGKPGQSFISENLVDLDFLGHQAKGGFHHFVVRARFLEQLFGFPQKPGHGSGLPASFIATQTVQDGVEPIDLLSGVFDVPLEDLLKVWTDCSGHFIKAPTNLPLGIVKFEYLCFV